MGLKAIKPAQLINRRPGYQHIIGCVRCNHLGRDGFETIKARHAVHPADHGDDFIRRGFLPRRHRLAMTNRHQEHDAWAINALITLQLCKVIPHAIRKRFCRIRLTQGISRHRNRIRQVFHLCQRRQDHNWNAEITQFAEHDIRP